MASAPPIAARATSRSRPLATGAALLVACAGLAAPAAAEDPMERVAHDACDDCHAFPPPETRPRSDWRKVVYEMAGLAMSGIGAPPGAELRYDFDVERLIHYFEERAPEVLPPSATWPAPAEDAGPRFVRHAFAPPGGGAEPSVSNVRFLDLDADGSPEIVAADMGAGYVYTADPKRPEAGLVELAPVPHPAHVEMTDLDGDGVRDLLVADLGSYGPGDHEKASVVWVRRLPDGGRRLHTLASGLPRVADARAADFDGDGDLDVLVAAFGWRAVGEVLLLENLTEDFESPRFQRRTLDPRTGAIHVPVADLDGDGRLDFVALLSQHHEVVEAFLNRGAGVFETKRVYAAPHPGWGSSGIDLADLDGDGDQDVLLTHGDMLDDFLLKPWHGIQWLENRGEYPFEARDLAPMNGVHRAQAGDLDGDGDLDVVACAFVQTGTAGQRDLRSDLPSLVWLEQTAPGRFERRTLEQAGQHATLDLADYDGDGDLDLLLGNFRQYNPVWVELWENLGS